MPPRPKLLPPVSRLREMFSYEPKTGRLINLVARTNRRVGERADHKNGNYLTVWIDGQHYHAHRIAWAIGHGVEPVGFIDHINGNMSDNRLTNLRLCSHVQNMQNSRIYSHNTSGIKGVSWDFKQRNWRVSITVNCKRIYVGRFKSKAAAAVAICQARMRLHGDFARAA